MDEINQASSTPTKGEEIQENTNKSQTSSTTEVNTRVSTEHGRSKRSLSKSFSGIMTRSKTRLRSETSEIQPSDSASHIYKRKSKNKSSHRSSRSRRSDSSASYGLSDMYQQETEAELLSKAQSLKKKTEFDRERLNEQLREEESLILQKQQEKIEQLELKKQETQRRWKKEDEELELLKEEILRNKKKTDVEFERHRHSTLRQLELQHTQNNLELEAKIDLINAKEGSRLKTPSDVMPQNRSISQDSCVITLSSDTPKIPSRLFSPQSPTTENLLPSEPPFSSAQNLLYTAAAGFGPSSGSAPVGNQDLNSFNQFISPVSSMPCKGVMIR